MNIKLFFLIVIILISVVSAYYFVFFSNKGNLEDEPFKETIESSSFFVMKNDLSCTVKQSSEKDHFGRVLSLLDLETNNPKFLSDLGGTTPLTIIFESDDTLVVGMVASGSGSTDIFTINKSTGIFGRTESGNFWEVFAIASKGLCI